MTIPPLKPPNRTGNRDPFSTRDAMLSWVRDLAPYGIFTTDTQMVIRDWNQWLAQQSGLEPARVIGRPLFDIFPDLVARRMDEHFQRALRGEVTVLSSALHKYLLPLDPPDARSGSGNMLQTARIAPLPGGDRIIGTITIIEDVTQRECQANTLRRQQEYDRVLSEALGLLLRTENPLGVMAEIFPRIAAPLKLEAYFNYLLSPDGSRLHLASAAGIAPEARKALGNMSLTSSLCGDAVRRRSSVVVSRLQQTEAPLAEAVRRIGLRCYAVFPLLLGERVLGTISFGSYSRDLFSPEELDFLTKVAQYLAIGVDRANREGALREAQSRLTQHATELESKVAERTQKLHEIIQQLESFSYTVAHDLRAPIRALTGYTDILVSDFGPQLPDPAQELMRRLQRATSRLDGLTRDLLKLSRVVREDVVLTPVNLDELVDEISSHIPALHDGTLTVHRPLGTVLAHRTMLQQCLANLFDNAVKFATPGLPLALVLRAERRPPAGSPEQTPSPAPGAELAVTSDSPEPRIRIWVEDNGIGIPEHAHGKIWGMFERVTGPTQVEGTGIGLAIVARAVQQMGGSFGVESRPGHGSRFWVELRPA